MVTLATHSERIILVSHKRLVVRSDIQQYLGYPQGHIRELETAIVFEAGARAI